MTRQEALQVAKPILFNTDMVRTILGGRKTVTRRLVKPQPPKDASGTYERMDNGNFQLKVAPYEHIYDYEIKPRYRVGDILYVRETWCKGSLDYGKEQYYYRADNIIPYCTWHPSIHMPKEAARIFLRVTDVRAERLQNIITGDYRTTLNIKSEGLISPCCYCILNGNCEDFITQGSCRLFNEFIKLWDSTIKKSDRDNYGWEANSWVWVIEFERLEVT